MSFLASRSVRFSSGNQPKSKHNTVMAFPLRHHLCLPGAAVAVHAHHLFSRSGSKPLPNTSVEATNCSKLQFAPHLER
jgi:hypothetical protein